VGSLSLPIHYGFGVSAQTFVLEYNGRFYESLVSYYPRAGLAITMGSERIRPQTLVEAMGRETPTEEIVSCFGCHSSGGVSDGKLALDSMRPGLDCEHCHAGARAHLDAMTGGKPAPAPKKLGEMPAEDMSTFCGSCHRTWNTVLRMKTWGPLNVRFQPYRLATANASWVTTGGLAAPPATIRMGPWCATRPVTTTTAWPAMEKRRFPA
jgi:hypothetical protein